MSVADKMADHFVPEVDPDPAEPRMVIWSTLRCLELQIDQHEELHNSTGVVSWELLKHMVRLAKRHAHEEGKQIGAAERQTDEWRTLADQANAKLRETEQELQRLRNVHLESQSEEVAAARAEIETLRQERDLAQVEVAKLRTLNDALLEKDQRLRPEFARVCHLLEGNNQELARLRDFVELAREQIPQHFDYADVCILRAALSELDAGPSEPAPVAEPLNAEGGA